MPVPPAVQGFTGLTQQVRLILESTPGEQLLLPQTAGAATLSLVTQPNAAFATTTGCQLHFFIIGNPQAGSVVITGTAPVTGGAVVSQAYHVPVAPQNSQGYSEFTTSEVFATVGAAGIALTTLTPCQVIVFASPAGKFLVPMTADMEEKIAKHSPPDKRGILFKNIRVVQLTKGVALDRFDADLYPDSLWAPYMLISNNPTIATVPAVASVLLAATTKAATMTLTTAPKGPGQFLIFTPAANSVAGTIVLTGLDQFGAVATETITVGANNNPVYSTKRYSSLTTPGTSQFTTTGLSAAATLAVSGAYAWSYTFTNDGLTNTSLYSACLEIFDGVINKKMPYTILSDGTFDWQKEKEILFNGKGFAQDYLLVGDPTSLAGGVNTFATLAQPRSNPMVSWPGTFFIDALPSGVPGTTQEGGLLAFKLQLMTGQAFFFPGDGMQRSANVTRTSAPDFALDATLVKQSYAYTANDFKPNQKVALVAAFQGDLLGSLAGTTYYESWTWTLPGKIDTWKTDPSKNPVEVQAKIMSEYDFGLGYGYKLVVVAQQPPTYTL